MRIPNLDFFASLQSGQPIPDGFGAKLKEALSAIGKASDTTEQQTNANPTGQPAPPPTVNGITVGATNGHHTVTISDLNPGVRRGVNYWLERDTSPNFTNPHIIDLGQSRNHQEYLGNGTYYWRGYSSYGSSPAGKPAYHGSEAQPAPVNAGGPIGPGVQLDSQGSGTGAPAQGLVGPGPTPVRSTISGVPWGQQRAKNRGGFIPPNGPPGIPFPGAGAPPTGGGNSGIPFVICTQATFPVLASIGASFIYVTDFPHFIFWDGTTSPVFADGGNCYIALFEVDPGAGWHLCDGSAGVTYLKADGTTGSVTLPDLTTSGAAAAYLKAGDTNSGPNAAVAPTISGHTEDTAIGFTPATGATPASVSATAGATAGTDFDAVTAIDGGGGGGGGSLDTDPHQHNLTSGNAPITATGEPRNLVRRPYFRR